MDVTDKVGVRRQLTSLCGDTTEEEFDRLSQERFHCQTPTVAGSMKVHPLQHSTKDQTVKRSIYTSHTACSGSATQITQVCFLTHLEGFTATSTGMLSSCTDIACSSEQVW